MFRHERYKSNIAQCCSCFVFFFSHTETRVHSNCIRLGLATMKRNACFYSVFIAQIRSLVTTVAIFSFDTKCVNAFWKSVALCAAFFLLLLYIYSVAIIVYGEHMSNVSSAFSVQSHCINAMCFVCICV